MNRLFVIAALLLSVGAVGTAHASWLSKITGIDVDLNRGRVSIAQPDVGAIPEMIRALPKDLGQAALNPNAPILATAIRFSRGQALNRGTEPIPRDIQEKLSPYFPPEILARVRWTTANGISLDGALKNWFDQEGAITYDDVIVFANDQHLQNVELWAHELTHVLQYAQLGVETFAFQYSIDWNGLESQARDNASQIFASYQATTEGQAQTWAYEGEVTAASEQPTWEAVNNAAKLTIPAEQCIWVDNQTNTTGNICPVAIRVSGVVMRRLFDGYTFTRACDEPTCLFQPKWSGPLLSPQGFVIIGVTAAYQQ